MKKIKLLIPAFEIKKKVKELALKVNKNHKEIFCVVVLEGATVFFNDLKKELEALGTKVEFSHIKLSSYKDKESTGKIIVNFDFKKDIKEKKVLIVEDIVDTGNTLSFLKKYLFRKGAKDVKICALLDKKERRKIPLTIDYVGFKIPNKFVVGYGLDHNQKHRELDFIGYLE